MPKFCKFFGNCKTSLLLRTAQRHPLPFCNRDKGRNRNLHRWQLGSCCQFRPVPSKLAIPNRGAQTPWLTPLSKEQLPRRGPYLFFHPCAQRGPRGMGTPPCRLDTEVGKLTRPPKIAGLAKFSDPEVAKGYKPKCDYKNRPARRKYLPKCLFLRKFTRSLQRMGRNAGCVKIAKKFHVALVRSEDDATLVAKYVAGLRGD